MVLMTARPFRHPRTGVYYFRKGVPRDLRAAVGKWEEKRTLGTKDPAEACKRHREIAAAVEREWDALRCPPMASASQKEPKLRELGELEQWLGAGLDGYAQSLGVTISEASRPQILEAMNAACLQAAQALKLDAPGAYRPVLDAGRPSPASILNTPSVASVGSANGISEVTLTALTEGWWREAKVGGIAEATRVKYARAITRLGRFLGHDDASKVTPADIVRFKDHRLSTVDPATGKSLSASTVRSGDIAPLKAVFGWGVSNLHLLCNPAEKITLKVGKAQRLRSKAFTDAEAQALLTAATDVVRGREGPKAYAAKRWVPWLCAYTGARVGEMVHLTDFARYGLSNLLADAIRRKETIEHDLRQGLSRGRYNLRELDEENRYQKAKLYVTSNDEVRRLERMIRSLGKLRATKVIEPAAISLG